MKALSALAVAAVVSNVAAHYVFPALITNGVQSPDWSFARQTNNWQNLEPVTDVTSADIRCYTSAQSGTAPNVATVAAGSTVTYSIVGNPSALYHDGVVNVYMARVPSGSDVKTWNGAGNVWFKVKEIPAVANGVTITFPATNMTTIPVTIPASLPAGQYLMRAEHIALHVATTVNGAQFYISCAQLQVTGSGTATPGPLVAFPGAYTPTDPGILINIYWPIPTSYTQPGPAIWPAGGSGNPAPPTTVRTTTAATTTVRTTTSAPTTTTGSGGSSGGTVAQWAQCGGQGYTGPTVCASPFVCTVLNPFFSQCV
ncbi:hypothetical protein MKEN_00004400 [Mycena kentingensis (nom. inval.)]|nr:hypothetical protein MKEN_00004400 [Mycena kentingensis (nom. inval.)]